MIFIQTNLTAPVKYGIICNDAFIKKTGWTANDIIQILNKLFRGNGGGSRNFAGGGTKKTCFDKELLQHIIKTIIQEISKN